MRIRLLVSAALILFSSALSTCTDNEPTQVANQPEISLLQAHTPPHHAAKGAVLAQVPEPGSSYTGLATAAAAESGGGLQLQLGANGTIPRSPDEFIESVAVFGYGWVDGDTGNGIVAVIHPLIGRDSRQNPDGWHTHPVQLGAGTKPGGSSDFCILSIGTSQGGINIHQDGIRVRMSAHWTGISAASLDVAASFTVQADAACSSGLGVAVIDALDL